MIEQLLDDHVGRQNLEDLTVVERVRDVIKSFNSWADLAIRRVHEVHQLTGDTCQFCPKWLDQPAAGGRAGTAPVSDNEFAALIDLLRRHAENHLDQWERWRLATTYGDVFIHVHRVPPPGSAADTYDNLDAWLHDR